MRIYEMRDEQEISEDQTPPTETPVPEVNETSSYDVGYAGYRLATPWRYIMKLPQIARVTNG